MGRCFHHKFKLFNKQRTMSIIYSSCVNFDKLCLCVFKDLSILSKLSNLFAKYCFIFPLISVVSAVIITLLLIMCHSSPHSFNISF